MDFQFTCATSDLWGSYLNRQLQVFCSPTCRAGAYVPRASTGQTNPNSFCFLCACFASDYYHPPCSIPTLSHAFMYTCHLFPTTQDTPCPAFYAMLPQKLELGPYNLRLTSFRSCPSPSPLFRSCLSNALFAGCFPAD